MKESEIENYLVIRVNQLGGEVRKLRWIGRNGAPDRIVMLNGKTTFVELKAPGARPKPHQMREHDRMRRMGQSVAVVDSIERVDEVLA